MIKIFLLNRCIIKYINEIEKPNIDRYDWIAFNEEQIKIIHIWDQKPMLNP